MTIDKYKIVVLDELNLKLTVEMPKRTSFGKDYVEGETTEKFLGYFGTLSGALIRLVNNELKSQTDESTVQELIESLNTLESRIESKYGSRGFKKLTVGDVL